MEAEAGDVIRMNGAENIKVTERDAIAALKSVWLNRLSLPNKENILFELEIMLKGLDRFFNIGNLPLTNMEQVIAIDFADELDIVIEFVDRVVDLSGKLLEASRREDYQFRSYIESKVLGDYERTQWRERVLEQRGPEDSLFVLYSTFTNMREILKGLSKIERIPYSTYFNVGSLVSREIVGNRFFNPSSSIRFRPEYDRMSNRKIGRIIRSIEDQKIQRNVSMVVLAFNRLLLYLSFVDAKSATIEVLKSSLLFFALIHSEARYLMEFMEKNLPARLAEVESEEAAKLILACDSLSFQLQMELKKIHAGELLNLSKARKIDQVRVSVENSHGILANFFRQSILQILKVFQDDVVGEEIFPVFISRRVQGIKLREDLSVLQALMDKFEEIIETTEAGTSISTFVKYLSLQKAWARKMKRDTLPLMRYQDLIEFEKYFNMIDGLSAADLEDSQKLDTFKMQSKFFKIFLETTLGQIANRSELQDAPLDNDRIKRILARFIANLMR